MAYEPIDQYPINQGEDPPYAPPVPPPTPPGGGGAPPPGQVPPSGPPGGGGGGGGGPFSLPIYPNFGNLPRAPGFDFAPFRAPDMKSVLAEPGYAFGLQSGVNALEHSAAAQGRLRTGNTLNDTIEYGQNYGQQFYDNAFRRAYDTYGTNRTTAQAAYMPLYQRWLLGAQGLRDAMLSGYNAQLQHELQSSAPRGPAPDPLESLLPIIGGGEPPIPGGGPPMGYGGDPWTQQQQY